MKLVTKACLSAIAAEVRNQDTAVGNLCSRILNNKVAVGKLAVRNPTQLKKAVNTLGCLFSWLAKSFFRLAARCSVYIVKITQVLQHSPVLTSCFKRKYVKGQTQIVALDPTRALEHFPDDSIANPSPSIL